ncbi:MAG TPA: 2-oxoglutarate and iron-dependent oxygenase domain-containing protein [Aestuariivirgaceae bacterium]|nr:2-oxoglutarate and iron-dependent oxygenase domain-containing protein [Aestuariivirgaceae bacterium]
MTHTPIAAVPVIDLAPYFEGSETGRRAVAAHLGDACRRLGAFMIVGHGVPQSAIAELLALSADFFDQPLEEKMRWSPPSRSIFRGYSRLASEAVAYTVGAESPPDLREYFMINRLDRPGDEAYYRDPAAVDLFHPNIWSDRPAGFREAFSAHYRRMEEFARSLMRLLAIDLDVAETFFDDKIDRHFSNCSTVNYPAQAEAPIPGQLRIGAHTDYGSITILYQTAAAGGLQVQRPDGAWLDVAPTDGAFVVNIGDLMARWTNDRFISPMHRVVNPPRPVAAASRRQSIVFFHQPNYDAVVECLPGCRDATTPVRYPPVTSGEHLRSKLSASKARTKRTGRSSSIA